MDVKRMHEMIEKLSECAKAQFDKGIDKVDTCEMGKVIDMMKDLSEAIYYRELTKTMQDYDPDEVMEMFERYGDGGKRFYDHYRYADGRFAPNLTVWMLISMRRKNITEKFATYTESQVHTGKGV